MAYLTGRTQSVTIGNSESNHTSLSYGVPQGSKLGPVLFNSYIAPLSEIAHAHKITDEKYADDEQLILSFKPNLPNDQTNAMRQMEKCLNDISIFLQQNKLCNNCDKTEFLLIGNHINLNKITNMKFRIGGIDITPISNAKNLGVIFDKHMNMEKQINKMCKNAYFNIKNISKLKKNITEDDRKTLVNALVTPHLDYGNSLLFGVPQKQITKLQTAQNSAARLIKNVSRYESITAHRKDLHWLPIPSRIQYKILSLVWKTLKNQSPKYLKDLIKLRSTTRDLRNQLLLDIPYNYNQNNMADRSFSRNAPKLWNPLPINVKSQKSLEGFKRQLKTHLFKHSYDD